jgi:prophage regulatory protein
MARKVADAQQTGGTTVATQQTLPAVGFSRWSHLQQFIPVSRETWRKLVKEGRAPQPQRWTERCTVYSNEEIHRWMKNPAAYQVQAIAD